MALGYSRRTLGQTGDGHFSPVAAYAAESDMTLVLDVARFKVIYLLMVVSAILGAYC